MLSTNVDEILAYRPCEGYTRERVLQLAGGADVITAAMILDADISLKDRIYTIGKLNWLTAEQAATVKAAVLELITDKGSIHHEHMSNESLLHHYWPAVRFMAESTGKTEAEAAGRCEELIMGIVRGMLI